MLKIKIIAPGKIKEKYLNEGIKEYLKRLQPFAKMEIAEVADEPTPDKCPESIVEAIKEKEGQRILGQIKEGSYVIALAIAGANKRSEEMATLLEQVAMGGYKEVVFVIGGSLGLAESVIKRADALLSFGAMTFPHQLMRLMLLEQIYRGFKINRGEPYHK